MAKLSKAELTKREELIMQMKKNKRNLVKKYGSDAEKVMYGRATNIAKKLAEQNMENTRLREMVRAALSGPLSEKVNEGPEDKTWGVYVKSLVNDIRLNGVDSYVQYSEEDFIEDYENYIGDKMSLEEDLDIGHEDNEPHMLKADLYRIGKYAMELYQMIDGFEGKGEVDFPSWFQAKITKSVAELISAKHWLDFETKEPEIDATLDTLTIEEPVNEDEVTKIDILAAKIAKALKNPENKSSDDQHNIKQARKAMNDDNIEAAEKIIKPYLAEKIAKQLKAR